MAHPTSSPPKTGGAGSGAGECFHPEASEISVWGLDLNHTSCPASQVAKWEGGCAEVAKIRPAS